MSLRITDSEPQGHDDSVVGSESLSEREVTLSIMVSAKRRVFSDAVSAYVQEWLEEQHKAGEELTKLSTEAGLGKSDATQVRLGKLGVGEGRMARYAQMLGLTSAEQLRSAAYQWWLAKRQGNIDLTLAMRTARDEATKVHHATDVELDEIFAAYAHERFRTRDVDWWRATISEELREERRKRRLASAVGGKRDSIGASR